MARSPTNPPRHNSNFEVKLDLRVEAVQLTGKPRPVVLDAFAGRGLLWQAVGAQHPVTVQHLEIVAEDAPPGAWVGDNADFMRTEDLDRFDLVDLDAYGWPDEQLAILADRRAGRLPVLVVTCIGNPLGAVPNVVKDVCNLPHDWPHGAMARHAWDWWAVYLRDLGWRSHRRYFGSGAGGGPGNLWRVFEVLVPA